MGNGVLLYSTGNCVQSLGIEGWGMIRGKECIYTYEWVTLPYSRNQHDTVNQLDFNKNVYAIKNGESEKN